jgi:hypothetical protein
MVAQQQKSTPVFIFGDNNMNTFISAVNNQETTTDNGMVAYKDSSSKCVDFFFKAGAMRGKDIIPSFVGAYVENREYALRIALWLRDIREGAGERELYKQILKYLVTNCASDYVKLLHKTPELGRWDDILLDPDNSTRCFSYALIEYALKNKNGLCAKWLPRKGQHARQLREFLKLKPKAYRKLIVSLSETVEQKMSAKEWSKINYNHIPSLAASRYQKAFNRNDEIRYNEYKESLKKGEGKINANAVYPYDVIKSIQNGDRDVSLAQWEALPDIMGDEMILPMIDVSGSMTWVKIGDNKNLTPLDVAVSLGLYIADKNKGVFKDTFLTFSGSPDLVQLKGNILQKLDQMKRSDVEMNTNLEKAMQVILHTAAKGHVKQEDMPKYILILSDMQFDEACGKNVSAMEMTKNMYNMYGYELPKIVFWNLNARDNCPAKFNEQGVALISGFSPAIMKSVLKSKNFSPESVMLEAIMKDRYNF